jgi:hypothetical protein
MPAAEPISGLLLLMVTTSSVLHSTAPLTPRRRLNAQSVTCLPPNHTLAPNQHWLPRPAPSAAAGRAAAPNVTCPATERWCYSGSDLLPAGKANQSLASCCDLCQAMQPHCVGIVLTTRPGNAGLTCYPKSKMERPGAGRCTSGTMGQPFPPHSRPPPPPSPPPPTPMPLPPALGGAPVQLQHRASGLCLEVRQPSGNVEAVSCWAPSGGGRPPLSQLFQFHSDGTITDGWGTCLRSDQAHGIDDNVVAANRSCDSSACTSVNRADCTRWRPVLVGAGGQTLTQPRSSKQLFSMQMVGGAGQAGQDCLDAGSGGSTSDGTDVAFHPAAPAAPSGFGQAYCNATAPSWGGSVIKVGSVYHMYHLRVISIPTGILT